MSEFYGKYEQTLKRLEETAKQYTNIAPENGQFLYILIQSIQAQNVLEIGTSNGYSTIWLAAALTLPVKSPCFSLWDVDGI